MTSTSEPYRGCSLRVIQTWISEARPGTRHHCARRITAPRHWFPPLVGARPAPTAYDPGGLKSRETDAWPAGEDIGLIGRAGWLILAGKRGSRGGRFIRVRHASDDGGRS